MSSSSKKIGRYFTLQPETVEVIKQYSTQNRIPQGEVIDELAEMYLRDGGNKNKVIAKEVVDELDTRHADELTRLQSATKFTDINVQKLLKALNTLFWWLPNGPRNGTVNGPHQVLRDAENQVKQDISNNKENADNRR